MTKNDPQEVISRFVEAMFQTVSKDKFYGREPLTREEWAKLDVAWQRIKADTPSDSSLLDDAKILATQIIVGYENEHHKEWSKSINHHQCDVCYSSAKKLLESVKRATHDAMGDKT